MPEKKTLLPLVTYLRNYHLGFFHRLPLSTEVQSGPTFRIVFHLVQSAYMTEVGAEKVKIVKVRIRR